MKGIEFNPGHGTNVKDLGVKFKLTICLDANSYLSHH